MSRYVVVVNTSEKINEKASELGGEVLDEQQLGDQVVAQVKFEDEEKGNTFSYALNGTTFRAQWAAQEHARDKVARQA